MTKNQKYNRRWRELLCSHVKTLLNDNPKMVTQNNIQCMYLTERKCRKNTDSYKHVSIL